MKNFSLRKNVLIKNLVIICLRSHVLPSFTKKIPFIKVLKLIKTSRNSLIRLEQAKKATKKHSSRKRKESKAAVDKRGRGKVKAHLIKKPWRKKPARYNFSKLLSASFSRDKALHNSSALSRTHKLPATETRKSFIMKILFFCGCHKLSSPDPVLHSEASERAFCSRISFVVAAGRRRGKLWNN